MDSYRVIGEVDHDPFATEAPPPAAPTEDRATRFRPEEPPAEPAADYVVPPAPVLPTVKFADEPKPEEPPAAPKYKVVAPVDFDPFEQGSFIPEAAKAVAAGAVETTGGMLKGAAGQRQGVMAERAQRDARAQVLKDLGYTGTTVIADLPPDKQTELRSKLQAANDDAIKNFDITKDPFYRAGTATEKWSQDQFAAAHDYEDGWTRQLGQGFGSIAPFIAANFVPGLGQAVSVEAGYASAVGSQIDDAIKHGASKQQLIQAMKVGGVGGLTEQLPMEVLFERIPLPAMGKVLGAIAKVTSTAFAEGSQEAVQQVWQNLVAHYVYNPKQDPLEGVGQAALIGAVVGGAVATPGAVLKNDGEEKVPKADDTPDVAAPVLPEGTPAATVQQPEISTPGGLSAGPAAQPAGTEKQPESPVITEPAPAVADPRTLAKPPLPAVTAPAAGGVEVVPQTGTPSDIGAALGGQPIEQPAAPVTALPVPDEPAEFNIRDVIPETATPREAEEATTEHEARIRDIFRDEHAAEKRQAQMADVTTVAPAGGDIAAALATTPQVQQPETVGTGRALAPQPTAVGPATLPVPPAAAAPQPVPQAGEAAALTPAAGPPVAGPSLTVPAAVPGEPALLQEPAPAVAAFTSAPAEVPAAPLVGEQAAPPSVQPAAAPVQVGEPQAVEPVTLPKPGAKGEAIKAKARKMPAAALGRAPVAEAPTVQLEAAPVQAEPAEAAAAEKKAEPTKLSRDAASHALGHPELHDTMISHLPGFRAVVDEVAAQVVAKRRAEHPGESMGEVIRGAEADIVAAVKQRMAPAEQEEETQREARAKAEEGRSAADVKEARKAKAEEKVQKQAAETKGQKKERTKKGGEKSGTGIRGESEKTTLRAIEKEQEKPEAERDQLLMAWQKVHARQKILPKNPKPEAKAEVDRKRAEAVEQKQQIQELRAQKAEAGLEAREGLTAERAQARDQVKAVLEAHPLPQTLTSPRALADHVKAFRAAVKAAGVKLADHIDRTYQSMEENLAIFARKISTKPDSENTPHDFAMAQLFQQGGFDQDFYGLTTNEKLEGSSYNEQIGADDIQGEASRVREDTSLASGVHRHEISSQTKLWDEAGEEDALQRAGRTEVRGRDAARQAREQEARKPSRDISVTRPSDNARVSVKAETRKGSDVLREVNRMLSATAPRGFISTIQNALVRHLTSMVGDIDVHFVSAADMMQLHTRRGVTPGGLYYNYSAAQRAKGERPQVFIDEELLLHPAEYIHTALHEMTHAATSLALTLDTRGTAKIVGNMMRDLSAQLSPHEREQFSYAFRSPGEFIAEAFSNQQFQDLLGVIPMPAHLRRQVGGLSSSRTPSWWDGVVGMISNAVGMLRGQLGQSYMEHVAKLLPEIAVSQQGQRVLAREAMARSGRTTAPELTGRLAAANDEQALDLNWRQLASAAKSRAENALAPSGARLRDVFATTGELIRRSEEPFGGINNPYEAKARLHLTQDSLRKDLRRDAGGGAHTEEIQLKQMAFAKADKAGWRKAQLLMHEASRHEIDPTVGLNHPHNKHVAKTGPRSQPQRDKHAALEKQFSRLSPQGQQIVRDTAAYYRAASVVQSEAILRHGIDNALRYGAALPPGKTTDDAIQWIKDGKATRDLAHQTQEDKDFHAALGNTAETLAKVPFLREPKGMYVPFMRRGRFFISARERPFGTLQSQRNVPHGATLDAVTSQEKDAPNRLLFRDRKDLDAFIASHPGEVKVGFLHVDPKTGKKVPATFAVADPSVPGGVRTPKTLLTATVQNRRVEMSDSKTYLVARAKQLRSEGHHASDVGASKKGLNQAARQLATPEVSRLINNLKQTTPGSTTVSQQQVEAAINDAHLRSLTTPGQLQRGMKRDNILGEDIDLIKATRDYGRDMAHHLANLKLAPQTAAADKAVTDYIDKYRHLDPPGSGRTLVRQAMNDELDDRIMGYKGDSQDGKLAHATQVVRDITYLRHLFSPHYTIMQLVQPYTTSLPVLNSKFGPGGTSRQLRRAYRIGVAGSLGRGVLEMGRATKNIWPGQQARTAQKPEDFWLDAVSREADGAQLADVINEVVANGWGASSGIEAGGISELDMSGPEKFLSRVLNIAKAMPEWAESVNRYTTAIAAYRLGMLQHGDHARAVRDAALTVEETQGGYGAANNPTIFQNPLVQPFAQFRKYSLAYGQLYWKNVAWSVGKDPVKRRQAIKALVGLSATLISLAGIGGLPLVEPLRMVINILAAAGLKDDDWDKDEQDLQAGISSLIKWASGSKRLAEALGEASVRGFTRLANIDTSNTFGADSLTLFGQPKSNDAEGVAAWLFKAVIGAQGGMLFDSGAALIKGDLWGAIPWPKLVDNVIKAYTLKTEGTVSKKTGEEFHKPFSTYEAIVKATGFRPAEESRPFEGGKASQNKRMSEKHRERGTLMARWRSAKGAARQQIFNGEVRDWNREHKNPDDKIQMQDLMRSITSAKSRARRLEKEAEYED